MSESISKSKAELIDEKLMGLEITDNDKEYGVICRIVQTNGDFTVYTTLGFSFNAGLILNLVAAANRNDKAAAKSESNSDPKVEFLPPQNVFTNTQVRSRPKAHSKPMRMNGTINNTAKIDDQEINITTYVSSGDSFPEESRN